MYGVVSTFSGKSIPTVQVLEPNEENVSNNEETNYVHKEEMEVTGEAAALANM